MPPSRAAAPRPQSPAAELLRDGVLDEARLREDGLVDVTLERVDLANLRGVHVLLERVVLRGCRMTGLQLAESTLRDVTLEDCRIDLAAFRMSRFERVAFRGCNLLEADFAQAQLGSVVLERCDLAGADLSHATFRRSEMHGCRTDGLIAAERLNGVTMPWPDVVSLAGELAAAVGIAVLDEEEA